MGRGNSIPRNSGGSLLRPGRGLFGWKGGRRGLGFLETDGVRQLVIGPKVELQDGLSHAAERTSTRGEVSLAGTETAFGIAVDLGQLELEIIRPGIGEHPVTGLASIRKRLDVAGFAVLPDGFGIGVISPTGIPVDILGRAARGEQDEENGGAEAG